MSITLQFAFEVDGTLTDVTSAVLSDSGGTYGVKRNDTNGVVVADGTAMTKVETGTYEYSFTPPADGLTYTWVVEYVYDAHTYRDTYTYEDTTQVVTLTEIKEHLRVTTTDDDTMLNRLIDAATNWCQQYQRRKYLTTTCTEKFDDWPDVIRPRWSPLIAVTSITYVDTNGATQTWSSAQYSVDTTNEPGRIEPAYSYSYPTLRGDQAGITLTYTAGYGVSASSVPAEFRHAIMLLVGHLYAHREDTTEISLASIPMGVRVLLGQQRMVKL